jgi:hypothetical protein
MTNDTDATNETAPTTTERTKLPTHWRKVLTRTNKHMLFSEDLGPVGTKVDVEISDVTIEKVKNEDGISEMPSLSFTGAKKRLGLNKGNCKTMKKLCDTDDPNQWSGWITLVVVSEKIAGEPTDCIRIAPKRPEPKQKAAAK